MACQRQPATNKVCNEESMEPAHVAVVEDDAAFRDVLTEILTEAGYSVTATDSTLGLKALVRRERPQVIVLDIGLPYRSGASLLADLKADPETSATPVIVVSANPEVLTPERGGLVARVLDKPLDVEHLLDAVRAVCAPAESGKAQ